MAKCCVEGPPNSWPVLLVAYAPLSLTVQSDRLVVFGDGVEDDRLLVSWGQQVDLGRSDRVLRLV